MRSASLPVLQQSDVPVSIYVSNNAKTGFSINTPIDKTCRPTEACSRYCYGNYGPISFANATNRQNENYRRFGFLATASPRELAQEAERVYNRVYPERDYLRMFGVGDLTEGSVRFINALAKRYPKFAIWVATRRIDLARKLVNTANLHIMVSIDETTKGDDFHKTWEFVQARAPQAFGAYVQQREDEAVPPWVKVIFVQHGPGGHRKAWSAEHKDARMCPVTVADGPEHDDACNNCRYCFNVKKRQSGRIG